MRLHPSLLALGALLALAACRPGAAEYSESEAPNTLTLDKASRSLDVRFPRGSSRLPGPELAKLRTAVAQGLIVPSDRVTVASGGSLQLAAGRFASISSELARYGIIASQLPLADVAADRAVIQNGR